MVDNHGPVQRGYITGQVCDAIIGLVTQPLISTLQVRAAGR